MCSGLADKFRHIVLISQPTACCLCSFCRLSASFVSFGKALKTLCQGKTVHVSWKGFEVLPEVFCNSVNTWSTLANDDFWSEMARSGQNLCQDHRWGFLVWRKNTRRDLLSLDLHQLIMPFYSIEHSPCSWAIVGRSSLFKWLIFHKQIVAVWCLNLMYLI